MIQSLQSIIGNVVQSVWDDPKIWIFEVVAVAQLVERSLPKPEVHSSNPVVGKKFIEHLFTINYIEKKKLKKKRPGTAH